MKVENITINDSERISSLLFGPNAYSLENKNFEYFKKFIEKEVILMNWDMYPIMYINRDDLDERLDYLKALEVHDIIYVASINVDAINIEHFDKFYEVLTPTRIYVSHSISMCGIPFKRKETHTIVENTETGQKYSVNIIL